tara:strand:+ start:671 stop:997 length:327 start_codon:yes stop_codon:yes gene_type:complete
MLRKNKRRIDPRYFLNETVVNPDLKDLLWYEVEDMEPLETLVDVKEDITSRYHNPVYTSDYDLQSYSLEEILQTLDHIAEELEAADAEEDMYGHGGGGHEMLGRWSGR